jgi:NAD(P)-dependent dehydrogenase (short-subunit alcohol dehydrogenase family)
MSQKLMFITGVSSGLGQALAIEALAADFRVVGTVRHEADRAEFERRRPGHAIGRLLDVTDHAAVAATVAFVEAEIGPIEVLVNNAGYGHEGTVEESSMEDLRRQFEVNVFGPVAVIKAVLPFMRLRRRGRIINITSMAGLMTMPGLGYYHGSKFALEGISGALGKETTQFGIAVTAVEPGTFRTDWAGRSMMHTLRTVADYDALINPRRASRDARSGKQPGDPAKAARAILTVIDAENPPAHVLLGPDALKLVRAERQNFDKELSDWESLSLSTNFD